MDQDSFPHSFSPDGKRLAYAKAAGGTTDLFVAPLTGDPERPTLGPPQTFLATPAVEARPAFSPDGRWIAYESNESGRYEIYVRPYPGPGGKWQVSSAGGAFAVWSRGTRELLYRTLEERLMTVAYTAQGDTFAAERARPWSDLTVPVFSNLWSWDLAPDGKHVAAVLNGFEGGGRPETNLIFLLNFADELQRLASK
jgi:serine/threonine-protein kinase